MLNSVRLKSTRLGVLCKHCTNISADRPCHFSLSLSRRQPERERNDAKDNCYAIFSVSSFCSGSSYRNSGAVSAAKSAVLPPKGSA
jgi:hypothetical protein